MKKIQNLDIENEVEYNISNDNANLNQGKRKRPQSHVGGGFNLQSRNRSRRQSEAKTTIQTDKRSLDLQIEHNDIEINNLLYQLAHTKAEAIMNQRKVEDLQKMGRLERDTISSLSDRDTTQNQFQDAFGVQDNAEDCKTSAHMNGLTEVQIANIQVKKAESMNPRYFPQQKEAGPNVTMVVDQNVQNSPFSPSSPSAIPSAQCGEVAVLEASKQAGSSRNEDIAKFVKYIESLGIKVHKRSNELHEIQLPGPEQPKAKLVLDLAERLATSTLTELNQAETKTANASVL